MRRPGRINTNAGSASATMWFLVAIVAALPLASCSPVSAPAFSHPSFSKDNSTIFLDHCPKNSDCTLAAYELHSASIRVVDKPIGVYWRQPRYDASGDRVFFVMGNWGEPKNQIAFINRADFSKPNPKVTVVTASDGFKLSPVVSPDGDCVLFGKSTRFRYGTKRPAGFDLFEANILSGGERRFTNHDFYSISPPSYFANGDRVLFSGDGMGRTVQVHKKYSAAYGGNTIFLLEANQTSLKPLLERGEYSSKPSPSSDGRRIAFISRTNDLDNPRFGYVYDVFLRENDQVRRVTWLSSITGDLAISPDGSRIALTVLESDRSDSKSKSGLWLLNLETDELTRLKLPSVN